MDGADRVACEIEGGDSATGLIDRPTGISRDLVLDHGVGVGLEGDGESSVAVDETVFDVIAIGGAAAEDTVLGVIEQGAVHYPISRADLNSIGRSVLRRRFPSVKIGHAIANQRRVRRDDAIALVGAGRATLDDRVVGDFDAIAIVFCRSAVFNGAALKLRCDTIPLHASDGAI